MKKYYFFSGYIYNSGCNTDLRDNLHIKLRVKADASSEGKLLLSELPSFEESLHNEKEIKQVLLSTAVYELLLEV